MCSANETHKAPQGPLWRRVLTSAKFDMLVGVLITVNAVVMLGGNDHVGKIVHLGIFLAGLLRAACLCLRR